MKKARARRQSGRHSGTSQWETSAPAVRVIVLMFRFVTFNGWKKRVDFSF